MKKVNACALRRETKDTRSFCILKAMLCLALAGASTSVVAQLEHCVSSGGGVTTEQCNCTDKFGRAATRECRQLVSELTGTPTGRNGGVCGVVCNQCECAGPPSGGVGFPQTPQSARNPNQIKFCVGEFEGNCPSDSKWLPCEVDSHEGAPAAGDRLCRERGKTRAATSRFSVHDGNKCGYTVWTADCS